MLKQRIEVGFPDPARHAVLIKLRDQALCAIQFFVQPLPLAVRLTSALVQSETAVQPLEQGVALFLRKADITAHRFEHTSV